MKDEEQRALASFYDTWETGRLVDAITNHSTEYAPQALRLMAKEIEKRGVREPEVKSVINSQPFSALVDTGTSKHTRQSVARPGWFLIPLPATLVVFLVIGLCQIFDKPTGGPDGLAVFILLCGGAFFPVGLFRLFPFVLPRGAFEFSGMVILACLGYALYIALIIWGYRRPSLKLLFVLCGLLLLNIAGCSLLGHE